MIFEHLITLWLRWRKDRDPYLLRNRLEGMVIKCKFYYYYYYSQIP